MDEDDKRILQKKLFIACTDNEPLDEIKELVKEHKEHNIPFNTDILNLSIWTNPSVERVQYFIDHMDQKVDQGTVVRVLDVGSLDVLKLLEKYIDITNVPAVDIQCRSRNPDISMLKYLLEEKKLQRPLETEINKLKLFRDDPGRKERIKYLCPDYDFNSTEQLNISMVNDKKFLKTDAGKKFLETVND